MSEGLAHPRLYSDLLAADRQIRTLVRRGNTLEAIVRKLLAAGTLDVVDELGEGHWAASAIPCCPCCGEGVHGGVILTAAEGKVLAEVLAVRHP